MKTVVFTAQAFGFGPVSKMLAVSESLFDVRKIFFGTGVALDLARLHSFDEIYNFNRNDREKILSLLQRADLFVNVMDFPLGDLAKEVGCPYYVIDTLLWFWPKCPESVEHATHYFCQEFFGRVEPAVLMCVAKLLENFDSRTFYKIVFVVSSNHGNSFGSKASFCSIVP